jgi:hypothetical protein
MLSLSCTKNEDEKIIPREDLVALLTELHCADAIITQKGLTGIKLKDSIPAYYGYILKKYHTSNQGFNVSIEYYSEDVHEMLSIYDEVIANINNKIPKKLSDKSIYKIFDLALEEATVKSNPDKWFGTGGRELWNKNKSTSIIGFDSVNRLDFSDKLKYQSLLMLKASIIVYPDDSSKNLRMVLKINYSDKTSESKEKQLTDKNRAWKDYQLFIKTDSTKKTESFESFVLQFDSLTGKRHISVNNITLRQYGPLRDTADLMIKENPNKPPVPNEIKKTKNQKFNLLRKQKPFKTD